MRITKRQLSRIIREQAAAIAKGPITKPGATSQEQLHLRDIDNGRPMATRVSAADGMITIEFSNAFVLHLDTRDAQDLGNALANVAVEHGQHRAFKATDEPGYE